MDEHLIHKIVMRNELEKRSTLNPRYSLRAFARDLDLSPSHLSGILNGKYGLSRQGAIYIARKIGLSRTETEFFVQSVESVHGRSQLTRKAALEKLVQLKTKKIPHQLKLDQFRVIADWFHFAILQLTYLKSFKPTFAWVAKALGLQEIHVSEAIERLRRLNMLQIKDGQWHLIEGTTETDFNIPSEAVKTFHTQLIEKSKQALRFQSIDDRDFRSTILSIRKDRIFEAKAALKKLHAEFCEEISGDLTDKDQVYCLSTQFFSLTDIKEKSK